MRAAAIRCPAKINRYLRILAREDSGYHQIETLFQGVGLFDRLEVRRRDEAGIALEVRRCESGPGTGDILGDLGDPARNTVRTAATAFFEATGIDPAVEIVLAKAIPAGTGLGGASSDAAGALDALNFLYGHPLATGRMMRIGRGIGSDVAFFCQSRGAALAWGRGDRMLPLAPSEPLPVVIAVPAERMATATAYREASSRLDLPAGPAVLDGLDAGQPRIPGLVRGNDFEPIVFGRWPQLSEIRDGLARLGAVEARLTGSGSAVFGIFADGSAADRATRRIAEHPASPAVLRVDTLAAMPDPEPGPTSTRGGKAERFR